ncbi:MAG: cysteine-rich CWC family protein [Rhodocyclaceae bacterium]|nr:cysteine-rich CWC family protein [Rhodocyclaceae bacterium]
MTIDDRKSALATRRSEPNTRCSACGAALQCGAIAGNTQCWCMELPALPLPADATHTDQGCLCRRCLELALAS